MQAQIENIIEVILKALIIVYCILSIKPNNFSLC
jgi:hypothetical protein